jgi:hypothetical protein
MPVPRHFRITFRGIFKNTPEEWSFHLKYSRQSGTSPDATVDSVDATAVTNAWNVFADAGYMSSATVMTDWRVYVMGLDNRLEGNPRIIEFPVGSRPEGAGVANKPPQIACAITSVGPDRGPAKNGRFFIPALSTPVGTDLRMSLADQTALLNASVAFVKDVSNAIDIPVGLESSELVNVSERGGPNGTMQVVDHMSVGRVLDTIRSRRSKLVEEPLSSGHIDW